MYLIIQFIYKKSKSENWRTDDNSDDAQWGARDGAMVRALTSHQCGPGSNPGVDAICGLSLLLVLSSALRGFSPGAPVFPSPQKTNISEFQFDQESGRWRTTLWTCYPQNHYLFDSKKILTNSFIFCYHCHTLFKQQLWTDFLDKTITFNHASAMFGSAQSGKWLRTNVRLH